MPVRVVHHDTNLGFVKTVNEGFRACRGDVVVLNADTVVTAGWLDRLVDAAGAADVATVTPLTCFGSICTLPRPVIDAFDLLGDDASHRRVRRVRGPPLGAAVRPEVITGVGFCMYVTRDALDRCGIFDEEAFGRGYGEEVDFCLRATRHGYRHLVEDSTYVHHHGGASLRRRARGEDGGGVAHPARPLPLLPRHTRRRAGPRPPGGLVRRRSSWACPSATPSRPHVLQMLHSPPGRPRRHREARRRPARHALGRVRLLGAAPRRVRVRAAHHVAPTRRHHRRARVLPTRRSPKGGEGLRRRSGGGARDGARLVRVRRRPHPEPDRLLARPPRGARPLRRPRRLFGARPVPRLPQPLAALPQPTGLRHPRRPLLLRPVPAREPRPRARRPGRASADDVQAASRHGRHVGVRHPERRRLPAARLRHRPRPHPDHHPRRRHPDRAPPTRRRRPRPARTPPHRLRRSRLVQEGPRHRQPPRRPAHRHPHRDPPLRRVRRADCRHRPRPTARTTTGSCPTCSGWPASTSSCSPAPTPRPSATS